LTNVVEIDIDLAGSVRDSFGSGLGANGGTMDGIASKWIGGGGGGGCGCGGGGVLSKRRGSCGGLIEKRRARRKVDKIISLDENK